MKLIVYLCLLIFLCQCHSNPYKKYDCAEFSEFYKNLNKTDTSNIIKELKYFIQNSGGNCKKTYIYLGDYYFFLDSLDLAEYYYRNILRIDYKNVYALYKIGNVKMLKNKYDSAIIFLDSAISLKSENGYIFNYNSNLSPNIDDVVSDEIFFQKAVCLYYQNQFIQAENIFDYCIYNDYKNADAYYFKALINSERKNIKQACIFIDSSLFFGGEKALTLKSKYCN